MARIKSSDHSRGIEVDSGGSDEPFPDAGVYAPPWTRKVLMSGVVEFRTRELPRLAPRMLLDEGVLAVIDDD